jgi:hypothetical protein
MSFIFFPPKCTFLKLLKDAAMYKSALTEISEKSTYLLDGTKIAFTEKITLMQFSVKIKRGLAKVEGVQFDGKIYQSVYY